VAAPDSVGLDPATLCGIGPRFKAWTEANVHSVLVIRHGKLVYERYFTGRDERLGQSVGTITFDAVTKHDLRSITKSVVALVLGIAIGKGQIAGIDQPVLPLLPEYADLRSTDKDKITLRDLLTMSLGLAWNEDIPYRDPSNSETQMDFSVDPVRYVLSRQVVAPPGTVFQYSGGSAMIIGRLLREATGQPLDGVVRAVGDHRFRMGSGRVGRAGGCLRVTVAAARYREAGATGAQPRRVAGDASGASRLDRGGDNSAHECPGPLVLRLSVLVGPFAGAWAADRLASGPGLWRATAIHRAGARPGGAGACGAVPERNSGCGATDGAQPVCVTGGQQELKPGRPRLNGWRV